MKRRNLIDIGLLTGVILLPFHGGRAQEIPNQDAPSPIAFHNTDLNMGSVWSTARVDWLWQLQQDDGSFPPPWTRQGQLNEAAGNGLGITALIAGYRGGDTVSRLSPTVDRLVQQQQPDGAFAPDVFSHSLAALGLAVWRMKSNDGRHDDALKRALKHATKAQRDDGTWPARFAAASDAAADLRTCTMAAILLSNAVELPMGKTQCNAALAQYNAFLTTLQDAETGEFKKERVGRGEWGHGEHLYTAVALGHILSGTKLGDKRVTALVKRIVTIDQHKLRDPLLHAAATLCCWRMADPYWGQWRSNAATELLEAVAPTSQDAVPTAQNARWLGLIAQLEADHWRRREAAAAALKDAGRQVLPLLARAKAATESPEVRSRLQTIQDHLEHDRLFWSAALSVVGWQSYRRQLPMFQRKAQ